MRIGVTTQEGEYFTKDGEKRACLILTMFLGGEPIIIDAETEEIVSEHDGYHAVERPE